MQDDFYEKEKNEFVPFFIGVVPIVILPISPINAIDNIEPAFVNNKMSRLTNPLTFETTKQVLHKIYKKRSMLTVISNKLSKNSY